MLDKLKLLLGIDTNDTSHDDLLDLLLSQATANAEIYTNNSDIEAMENVILEMAVYRYNLIGSEGLTRENYSGTGYIYNNGYPDYVLEQLRQFRKLRTFG